jgi:pimeloyl-ACP methyl ester carboxylesterase
MKHNNLSTSFSKETYVDLNGVYFFAKSYGEDNGRPTVVMDAGYGDYSKAWVTIIPEIVNVTRVLVYDRAGLGKSGKSPNPRTSKEMVKELNELLLQLEIKPPYILVGHSFGGVNVRLYSTEYPNNVSGILLVDSTPEDYKERFLPSMPKDFQEAYNKQFILEGTYDEFMESLCQLKTSRRHLGNIPLLVLSAGKKAHYTAKTQELWHELQREITDLSIESELIIADKSTHYIQNDQPDIVIAAIQRLLFRDEASDRC